MHGVVEELEKNGQSYSKVLQRKLKQQENRCKLFIN
jgi:hypothetical protein